MVAYILPNLKKDKALVHTRAVVEILTSTGVICLFSSAFEKNSQLQNVCFLPEGEALRKCDIVITIGGDGTILHAAALLFGLKKLLLGVNLGRVGFLATTEPTEIEQLSQLSTGNFQVEKRSLLDIWFNGSLVDHALNEVLISKTGMARTVDLAAYCDGILVNRYLGDGLLVATPTGSTAYALSAGGPILDLQSNTIGLTPICAHSLYSPSIVISGEREISIQFYPVGDETSGMVTVDGRDSFPICRKDSLKILQSKQTLDLVCFERDKQFSMVDKKLKWR